MVGEPQADQQRAFFRDRPTFEALKASVFPRILEDKFPGSPLRLWVAGCGSGEAVYSCAIALLEHLDDRSQDFRIQIFGTDADPDAIAQARRGSWPLELQRDVPAERLQRFFDRRGDRYEVSRRLRDLVLFAVHDLARDAPFSRLDLAAWLTPGDGPAARERVLRLLHGALNPIGFLVHSGASAPALFSPIDGESGVLLKKPAPEVPPVVPEAPRPTARRPVPRHPRLTDSHASDAERLEDAERDLRLAVEELEDSHELLHARDEQLRSMTGQLGQTVEALEASKRERDSANREGAALQEELHRQRTELRHTQDDLQSILSAVDEIVVLMGADFRIRRFSVGAERRLDLGPGDVGQRVTRLNAFVPTEQVQELAAGVITRLTPLEMQVRAADGKHYALRITPTVDESGKGVVLVMTEVVSRR